MPYESDDKEQVIHPYVQGIRPVFRMDLVHSFVLENEFWLCLLE